MGLLEDSNILFDWFELVSVPDVSVFDRVLECLLHAGLIPYDVPETRARKTELSSVEF